MFKKCKYALQRCTNFPRINAAWVAKLENVNLSDSIHSWFGCQLVNLQQLHNLAQCCASPEKISVRILMEGQLADMWQC